MLVVEVPVIIHIKDKIFIFNIIKVLFCLLKFLHMLIEKGGLLESGA